MSLGSESGIPAVMNVTPTGGAGYSNGGWGGDWGAWIILFLIFGMFGWGGMGGFGGFGGFGGGAYPTESILQRSLDTQTIIGKLDGINSGICDGFYAMNTGMLNGFNSVNQGLCNLGYNTQQGFNATQVAMMQGQNALQAQLASCCCDTQRAIDGVNYNMATNTCALQNTIQNTTRDIIDNANANSRAILDYLCQDKISTLQSENQALRLAASQSTQNATLMAAMDANKAEILRKTGAECPMPAYVVQPPQPVTFATNCCGQTAYAGNYGGCGCNSGCGC